MLPKTRAASCAAFLLLAGCNLFPTGGGGRRDGGDACTSARLECRERRACAVIGGEAACECEPGRFGEDCESECPGGAARPCSGHGTCDDGSGGAGECTCAFGWSGAACDTCDPLRVDGCAPRVLLAPDLLQVAGPVHLPLTGTFELRNQGLAPLVLTKAPRLASVEEQAWHGDYELVNSLDADCEGNERDPESPLAPEECARLVVRFVGRVEGHSNVLLVLETNDPQASRVTRAFAASTYTPAVELCTREGEVDTGCLDLDEDSLLDFGAVVPGGRAERVLVLRSKGNGPVRVSDELSGDSDFSLVPSPLPAELPPGMEELLVLAFEPAGGGPRSAQLLLRTDAPDAREVRIALIGMTDGPGLCTCVAARGRPCTRPAAAADFETVQVGEEVERILHLASCGTSALTIGEIALENDRGAFAANLPDLPVTLATGATLQVPLTFAPAAAGAHAGRLEIESNAASISFPLLGQGAAHDCRLVPAATLVDFGPVGQGINATQDVVLTNKGTEACSLSETPWLTSGAAAGFSLVSAPSVPFSVGPAASFRVTVGFSPTSASGTASGQLALSYAGPEASSAARTITVELRGATAQQAGCILAAQPAPSSPVDPSSATSRRLEFGVVRVGAEKTLPVTFQNVGGQPCTLAAAEIKVLTESAGFLCMLDPGACVANSADFAVLSQPKATLASGETTTLVVRYTPSSDVDFASPMPGSLAPFDVVVRLLVSDTERFPATCSGGTAPGCAMWKLVGRGVRAELSHAPGSVDFGQVTVGCSSEGRKVTLFATGGAPIEVRAINSSAPSVFRTLFPALPFLVPPGGSREIALRFVPPAGPAQKHEGKLRIENDSTNRPLIEVPLTGSGTAQSLQTDVFTLPERMRADLLFVVDDSGSMAEEQRLLADNARRFLEALALNELDYRLAVVTTDMNAAAKKGRFQGSPKVVTAATLLDTAATQFSNNVKALGTNGSADERGLQAMSTALSTPLITDPAENGGFLRSDATLDVIIVSDEEDGSPGSVESYVGFLRGLKGVHNARMVKLHAIVGDPTESGKKNSSGAPGCTGSGGDAASGDRYVAVQRATDGLFQSICAPDWALLAQGLAPLQVGGSAWQTLSRRADPDKPITVTVNGLELPAGAWSYDPASNAVSFTEGNAPTAGSTVTVTYEAKCFSP